MRKIISMFILGISMIPGLTVLAEIEPLTLKDCQTIAEEHYMPIKLAQEEIKVRTAKVNETVRNLWPNLSAKSEITDGASIVELGTPGFLEGSYGIQLSQTLFNGGKLWLTYKQAQLNKQISEEKYRETKLDMQHKIQEAYWNLVRVTSNYNQYEKTFEDNLNYFEMAKKLFADGTINKRQLIATEAQKNNTRYQKQSAEAEIEKFAWNLAVALGLDKPQEWEVSKTIPYYESQPNLEASIKQALIHNPTYLIKLLSLQVAKYEKKIQYSQNWPKVELSGFYGRSGGAFKREVLKLNEDYNISLKLTQPLAWNTLALSGFKQKTSPKLGQSSRTESQTASATLGLLDGYKASAQKLEASWQLKQAKYNHKKAKQTLMINVREAFYNVKKSKLQVANAQLEITLAKSELAIQQIQLSDEKVSIADVAAANNKLANSYTALNEAKVYYLLALSALNKAIGISDYSLKPGEKIND